MSNTPISPNAPVGTATEHTAVTPLDTTIADKMSAMLAQRDAGRKQSPLADDSATGTDTEAKVDAPVAPDNDDVIVEPEDSSSEYDEDDSTDDVEAPEEVSDESTDSTGDELIDFVDFAKENPKAKFKFTRNGKEVIIDAKKAAAILGQGSAIHEEARELKVQKAEFEEYVKEKQTYTEGLNLALELTVQPKLRQAYDEIAKTQGYQTIFHKQLAQTSDPVDQARIQAAIEQNEQYIAQQGQLVRQLKPRVDEFKEHRKKQVAEVLESSRKQFKDKELKNTYVYNELREKIADGWAGAKTQLVAGIDNIDLITSDEHILSLMRDGLKYRTRPKSTAATTSATTFNGKKTGSVALGAAKKDEITELREKANRGDKTAGQNLLMARLEQIRGNRK